MNQWNREQMYRFYQNRSEAAKDAAAQMYDNAVQAKDSALRLYERMSEMGMRQWRTFSVGEVALFKATLFAWGVFVGACLAKPLKKLRWLVGLLSLGLTAYFVWRFFFTDD